MDWAYLRRVDPTQHYWKYVALTAGAKDHHPAVLELVDRESTPVPVDTAREVIEGLRRIGFGDERYAATRMPVAIEPV